MRISKSRLRRIIREALGSLAPLNPRSREIDAALKATSNMTSRKPTAHASAVIAALVKFNIITPADQARALRKIAAAIEEGF